MARYKEYYPCPYNPNEDYTNLKFTRNYVYHLIR